MRGLGHAKRLVFSSPSHDFRQEKADWAFAVFVQDKLGILFALCRMARRRTELRQLNLAVERRMNKKNQSKTDAQKEHAISLTAQDVNLARKPKPVVQIQRDVHWDRYVDSRLKQFCLR